MLFSGRFTVLHVLPYAYTHIARTKFSGICAFDPFYGTFWSQQVCLAERQLMARWTAAYHLSRSFAAVSADVTAHHLLHPAQSTALKFPTLVFFTIQLHHSTPAP
jgi:hypothetical protein